MKNLKKLSENETRRINGGGRSGWDILYKLGRGCINYGIMIGNAIFRNNARYI